MRRRMRTGLVLVLVGLIGAAGSVAAEHPAQAPDLTPVVLRELAPHAPVILADGGKAVGSIAAMHSTKNPHCKQALKELSAVIEAATGVKLPVTNGSIPDGPALVIGDCPESRAAGLNPAALPPEGYAIKTAPNRVFLVARHEADGPARYDAHTAALASFMERFVGVRWYWPTNLGGRSVPKLDRLSVPPTWFEDAPVSRIRTAWPPFDAVPAKTDYRFLYALLGGGHSWPVSVQCHTPHWNRNQDYIKNRPECFGLRADGTRNFGVICYGHPRTLETYLEEIDAQLSGEVTDRGKRHNMVVIRGNAISVSPADVGITCQCKHCQALMEPDRGSRASASRLLGDFVARLAREVGKRWPGKVVSYLPYVNYTLAPEGLEFPDNVEVMVCGMPGLAMYKEPAVWKQYQANIDTWRELTGRKAQTWEYSCWPADRTKAPYQYPHVAKTYYQHNRTRLVGSFINGGNGDWNRQHVTLYCWMKLMWNPDLDVDAVMAEYCRRMYGPAAKTMAELLALQCRQWEEVQWPTPKLSMKAVYGHSFTKEVVARMQGLVKQAYKKAGDDEGVEARLDYYTHPFKAFLAEAQAVHEGTGLKTLVSHKRGDNPVVDGKLDDACWRDCDVQTFDRNGGHPAKYATEVRATWTLDGVSFGFRCAEPTPPDLVRTIKARDDSMAWHQDNIELFLDVTGQNEGRFYQWIINPNPTIYDSKYGDVSWNADSAKIAVHLGEDFWSLEVYLPNELFDDMVKPATNVEWVGQFTRHRISSARDPKKRSDRNRSEYTRLNYKFGGPSANTGDFGKIKFVE